MDESTISRLLKIGIVTAVNAGNKTARVKFLDQDFTSDWLYVLQRPGEVVTVVSSGKHTHELTLSEGDGTASEAGAHIHTATVAAWMPKVNDKVLVAYLPIFNSDGFVLGGIG